jgi:hypothetical protein
MITATFNGLKFENIEGYRISCRLLSGKGFDGHFYVYIDERRQALAPFEQAVKVGETQGGSLKPVRGTLEISDEEVSYQFKDIDLAYAELGATRRERTRYFEFRYDALVTDRKGATPITITGLRNTPLGPCGLGDDYKGGVDENRNLLGFRASVSANDGTVARFSNLGCMPKSFLAKVVDVNKELQAGNKVLPNFTVKFSQGDFDVTKENLVAFFVEESRGSLALQRTPPIHALLERTNTGAAIERLRPNEFPANELLWHDLAREFAGLEVHPGTVEVATLVFKQGFFNDLTIR